MTIQAIETRYAGCRFRSRLEARWVVFFDTLGLKWEYEPETFQLPSGAMYLPDFWLPECDTWFEVKGPAPDLYERSKLEEFALGLPAGSTKSRDGEYLKVSIGSIPRPEQVMRELDPYNKLWIREAWTDGGCTRFVNSRRSGLLVNGGKHWCKCQYGHVWVGWGLCWECHRLDFSIGPNLERQFYWATWNQHPDITRAYNAARSARFEWGEEG